MTNILIVNLSHLMLRKNLILVMNLLSLTNIKVSHGHVKLRNHKREMTNKIVTMLLYNSTLFEILTHDS